MSTDYRALCAELLTAIQLYTKLNPAASEMSAFELTEKLMDAMAATNAALAQPEPVAPTDEELEDFALQNGGGYFNCDCQEEADILTRKHISNYRAVLARWGTPTNNTKEENLDD